MPGPTEEDLLLAAALEATGVMGLPENYITVEDYMAQVGVTASTAIRRLRSLVGTDGWREHKFPLGGRERWVFWRESE